MKITLHTSMYDFGQMVDKITVLLDKDIACPEVSDFTCKNCFNDLSTKRPIDPIKNVSLEDNVLTLDVLPFLFRADFSVSCAAPALNITKDTADNVTLYHEEMFKPVVENGVYYRIYEPEAVTPRPLVLFLHGGGGCGEDNMLQLTDTLGAIKLAERVPDMYVMAPQAPSGGYTMEEMMARLEGSEDHFKVRIGKAPENDLKDRGWTRWYLAKVCDIIRRMIADGKVDPKRVYVTGMSMGGCGTLKAVSVAPDLFASCVPICPSMNGETWTILDNFPNVPAFIATSYIDHQVDRHAYLLRAIERQWSMGRRDIRFIMFTSEELATYGIGADSSLSTPELYSENHNSWILVLHNEFGILDWMFSHVKS